jgi:RHS repeat-associated protein
MIFSSVNLDFFMGLLLNYWRPLVTQLLRFRWTNYFPADQFETVTVQPALPPVAVASASSQSGIAPFIVTFNSLLSYDPQGQNLTSIEWTFSDDGSITQGVIVTHTFNTPGNYTATLRVQNLAGLYSTPVTLNILVKANLPPIASFLATLNTGLGVLNASFDASGSNDLDGSVVSYAWDFGDGSQSSGVTTAHVYSSPGTYNVNLTVTDDRGAQTSLIKSVDVRDTQAPTLTIAAPQEGDSFTTPQIAIAGSANEPLSQASVNGQSLTLSIDKLSFSGTFTAATNGNVALIISVKDLAGNATSVTKNVVVNSFTPVMPPDLAIDLDQNFGYSSDTGQLTSISTSDGNSHNFTYTGPLFTGEQAGTVSRAPAGVNVQYDTEMRPSVLTIAGPFNFAFNYNYSYDQDSQLNQVDIESITRDPASGLITNKTVDSTNENITYNEFGESASDEVDIGSAVIYQTTFVRDDVGRLSSKSETLDGVTSSLDYRYDAVGRLSDISLNGVSTSHHNYDSNGNRISGTCNGKAYTATYDAQDRLTSFKNKTFLYNDNGELVLAADALSQTSTIYNYDVLGRLISVKLPSGKTVSYQIDAEGRRVIKNVDGVKVHSYVYLDDLRIAAESNDDCDPSFDRNCATLKTNFTYSGDKPTPDYFFSLIDGNNYKIITDQIGSVRLVINTLNGSEAQRIDYDELGNVTNDTNPGFQPFGFAGGIYDQDTKLVHFGAREYDPSLGRWISKDPILFGGSSNFYSYALSDPINFVDPDGLRVSDPSGLVPPWIKNTELYKKLDALKDVYIEFKEGKLVGQNGSTWTTPGGHHQTITVDKCSHKPGSMSSNNSSLTNYEDTIFHELFHADKNLGRFPGGDEDHAPDQIPAFIHSIKKTNYEN